MRLLSEVVAGRFRQFNPLISCRPVSSPGRLKRRFPGARLLGRNPNRTVLSCCLTKLCIILPSMAVKKKTVRRGLDLAGKAEGTMTKYWAFARGGAWCNPKPTGGPYVCEQCRLDACGGNDATLIMQAVTKIELAPADVYADCGAVGGGTGGQRSSMTIRDIGWHYSRMEGGPSPGTVKLSGNSLVLEAKSVVGRT